METPGTSRRSGAFQDANGGGGGGERSQEVVDAGTAVIRSTETWRRV